MRLCKSLDWTLVRLTELSKLSHKVMVKVLDTDMYMHMVQNQLQT